MRSGTSPHTFREFRISLSLGGWFALARIEDRALRRVTGYAVFLAALLAAGALSSTVRPVTWPAAAVLSLIAVCAGPTLNRSARRWAWFTAAGLLCVNAAVIITVITVDHGQAPAFTGTFGPQRLLLTYLVTTAAAMLTITGRLRRSTWLGEVDLLVLVVTLTALIWTLLVLLLTHDSADAGSWLAMMAAYVLLDALVLVVLGRELRRDRPALPLRIWLLAAGAQMLLLAVIGFLIAHKSGERLPAEWLTSMRLLWLTGLAVLGGFALMPAPAAEAEPESKPESAGVGGGGAADTVPAAWSANYGSAPLRRPTLATSTLLVIALLGPPLEIAQPGFVNLVMLLLVALVCLLLRDARRRFKTDEAIRSIAVALAGAPDTARVLASTVTAVEACTSTRRHGGIVVCANGPEGPSAAATLAADKDAAELASDDARPTARVDRVLAGRPHITVVAPGQSADQAQLAIGVVGVESVLAAGRGPLELLAAQAGHALDRVRLTAERARRASEAQFRTLVRNAADVIMIVTGCGVVRFASPSARALLGDIDYEHATAEDVFGPANARAVRNRLEQPHDATDDQVPEYWTVERGRSELLELEVRFADLRTDSTVGGMVLTIRDVTEQKRLQRELEHLAFHDALTNLGNSHRFVAQIEAALDEPRSAAPGAVPVVALLQINNLWDINNLRGLDILNRVTIALGHRLEALTGGAARITGAVFGALAVPVDCACHDAESLARRLQLEMSRPVEVDTELVAPEVIVGAVPLAAVVSPHDAISRAGLAMAEAKSDRRRPWRAYQQAMSQRAVSRYALRQDLSAALAGNGLNLHYQPVVDLLTNEVVGFEALARWQHPDQGAIPPNDFVPLAEETGLIVPLGRWALRQAVADLEHFRRLASSDRPLRVAVNVSALQLAEPDFTADVAAALEERDIPAEALCLEITESSVIDEAGRTLDALRDLKTMGVSLAIDDFGTGHSALSYLPQLPFDILKVDKSFIEAIDTSHVHAEVVRGIVRIAGAVGMRVVAEGIEKSQQAQLLVDAACHYGQGFLYSRPVPLAKAIKFLDQGAIAPRATPENAGPPSARRVLPTAGLA